MNVAVNNRQWHGYEKSNTPATAIAGPGRLFGATYQPNTPGYMLVIGDQMRKDAPVFIGFAPMDGVGDLLQLVQMGSPDALAIITFLPATFGDVEAQRHALKSWQCRADITNWFIRSDVVIEYISKLRTELERAQTAALEEMEVRERAEMPVPATTEISRPMQPLKTKNRNSQSAQKRQTNRRKQKPRWL